MNHFFVIGALLAWTEHTYSLALPAATNLNIDPVQPQATICGDIIQANLDDGYYLFAASDVMNCLESVPFNSAVATRFITYWNQTLQFHSNTAFLKNPPPGYQQPACDIFGRVQQVQNRIDTNYYRNQYAFDADIQSIVQCSHDTHLAVFAGALSQFTFAAPFYLASVSRDGKELPEVYVWDDLESYSQNDYEASPISTIDGMPVVDYLERFASVQSFGMLEPDADWNQLMVSPAQLVIGSTNTFSGGAPFYPGDTMLIEHKNGTNYTWDWVALYNDPGFTGPLETGGDFYNFFVLGLPPANYEEEFDRYQKSLPPDDPTLSPDNSTSSSNASDTPELTSWHDVVPAYPADTLTHQALLGLDTSGIITSYFFSDIETAVISIPSFDEYDEGIDSFSTAVTDFIGQASNKSAKHVIIDLQRNSGGLVALALDVFRQFFPSLSPPEYLSRMRTHDLGDVLGNTMTPYFIGLDQQDADYDNMVSEEWVVTDRVNARTNQNFTSWNEFRGPVNYNADTFSLPQRYNFSDAYFNAKALGVQFPDCFTSGQGNCGSDPWAGKDVILLTDGTCASACALLVELMTQKAGARTVAVGGRPRTGPMQAASGTRGALSYNSDLLDSDFWTANNINDAADDNYTGETGMVVSYIGLNLRDQLRDAAENVPAQFLYLPADCRLFWSLANINDYGRLYHDTWSAIYNDTSLCVPGSTNATAPTDKVQPPLFQAANDSISDYVGQGAKVTTDATDYDSTAFRDSLASAPTSVVFCPNDAPDCTKNGLPGALCVPLSFDCQGPVNHTQPVCVFRSLKTSSAYNRCGGFYQFRPDTNKNTKRNSVVSGSNKGVGFNPQSGSCWPIQGDGSQSCDILWGSSANGNEDGAPPP